jgi:hypothetical protein
MKRIVGAALVVGAAALLGGCYPRGFLFTSVQEPHAMSDAEVTGAGKSGDKTGDACAMGILGLVAFGDASTDAAKKAGGITDVHSVEYKQFSILHFVFMQGCTIVHGK